jgi:hypothetical protein
MLRLARRSAKLHQIRVTTLLRDTLAAARAFR